MIEWWMDGIVSKGGILINRRKHRTNTINKSDKMHKIDDLDKHWKNKIYIELKQKTKNTKSRDNVE